MSVNYTPHQVDVPITDLDDSDDDILFHEQNPQPRSHDLDLDLDHFDFEQSRQPPMLQRLKAFFVRDKYRPVESYELRDATTNFDISDDEDGDKFPVRRRYKGVSFVAVVGLIVLAVFLLRGNNPPPPGFNAKSILSNSTHDFHPTTIMISLDGFHPHYISPKLTPTLNKMMHSEYGAPYMVPSFPSSTFPNHWTLITGLYPSEHGIVGNTFYDPTLKKQFVNTNPKKGGLDPDFWQGGEPIWKTAFKQGVNSAVHMWPGSEVPGVGIDGGPLEVDRYNGSELLSSKVKRVMTWLDEKDITRRPELILTYVPTVDLYGHKFGISGPNLTNALTYVDDFIDLMQREITHRNLDEIVNLIIVSDHGMAPTSNDRLLYLDDVVDMEKVDHIDGWPLYGLRPGEKYSVEEIFNEVKDNLGKLDSKVKDNYQLFKVEDIPEEWNFGGNIKDHAFNYRLAPIWIIPKVGYSITTRQQMKENNNDYTPKGVHGYNNTELLMRALFLGSGPYFRSQLSGTNKRIKPFNNTEVYNLVCQTLSIKPAPNNGTFDSGYIVPVVSEKNILPHDWSDALIYPNLPYEVDHIVEDATYDLLWKPKNLKETFKTIYTSKNDMASKEATLMPNINTGAASPSAKPDQPNEPDKPNQEDGFLEELLEDLNDIGEDIQDGLEGVGDGLKESFEDIGDGLKEGLDDVESGMESGWNKFSNMFGSGGRV